MKGLILIALALSSLSGHAKDDDYRKAANGALNKGGIVLVLSDLHLTVDEKGQLNGLGRQRLDSVKAWLTANPGKVAQVVWMGDILDAGGGPQKLEDRLALMNEVIHDVGRVAGLPAEPSSRSYEANHVFVMGNHDMVVDKVAFVKAKVKFDIDIVPLLPKGPDGKPELSEYIRLRPIPDNYVDVAGTKKVVELWSRLGYVATEGSLDAKEVILKGFNDPRFGRRRGFILEHVPKNNGGDFQLRSVVVREGHSKLADNFEMALISETAIGRINGDLHDPHNIESPPLTKDHGHFAPSHAAEDEFLIFRSVDAGTVGSHAVSKMHMKDGSLQPMPNTIVILSPSEGGTAYHYSVTDQGVEPYQLPPEKRTFSTPTPTFADDGTPLKHPQEEALKLVYRKHESEACDRAWETIWPQPIVITH